MNDLSLIRKNLFRKRMRAALMIVSIFFAFAIFGVLGAFLRAFYAGQDLAQADRLVVVNKINFTQPLPISYFNRIRNIEGVRQVSHANWFGGYYQDPKNFTVVYAVEPQTYVDIIQDLIELTPEEKKAFISERTGAVVGEALARKWGWKVGDRVPMGSNIYTQRNGSQTWDMTIVAIARPTSPRVDTNFMMFQYAYFNETRTFDKDTIGWILLTTTSPGINDRVSKTIDAMFANSPYETSTDTEKAFNKAFIAQLGNIALIVGLVVGAAFVTILMVVGNTMAMSIRERTREIGVLKTLGFPRGRILKLVLGESVLLTLLGGLPGMAVAFLATLALRDSISQFVPGLAVTADIYIAALILMLALGIVTGIIPAVNAMRLRIASALGRA
ncbi:MAG TPA: FtsX-like permease family protein [Alphaproteobacteria bacterium]|nr:FtsX-like permease family protein [Alphaproteobacteria bacterium]